MATAPNSSTIAQIFTAAKALIVTTTALDESKVFVVTPGWADKVRDEAESHATVRLSAPKSTQVPYVYAGGGRRNCRVRRDMIVTVFSRTDLDQIGRSDSWWADATYGHYLIEDQVCDAFHDRFLFDTDGTTKVTSIPVHYLPGAQPAERASPDPSWGSSALVFEVEYIQNLTLNSALKE